MPAGDQIYDDDQAELDGVLFALDDSVTPFIITAPGITGDIGPAPIRPGKTDLGHDHGAVGGRDYLGPREIQIPLVWKPDPACPQDAAARRTSIMERLQILEAAFEVSVDTDLELHIRRPGYGHYYFTGRPRGLELDLLRYCIGKGFGAALGLFEALDPTRYPFGS